MKKNLLAYRLKEPIPNTSFFILDLCGIILAFLLAFSLIQQEPKEAMPKVFYIAGTATLVYAIAFFLLKTYKLSIRYIGLQDVITVLKASALAIVILLGLAFITGMAQQVITLLIAHFLIANISLVLLRVFYKQLYLKQMQLQKTSKNIMIYGAGTSGVIVYKSLYAEGHLGSTVFAFIDDNPKLQGNTIDGLKILSPKSVTDKMLVKNNIEEVVISIQNLSISDLNKIVEVFVKTSVKLKLVPPVMDWINGRLEEEQMTEVCIDEVLKSLDVQIKNPSDFRGQEV